MARSYRELVVWSKAMSLAEAAYSVVEGLPDVERFGLSMQIRRAAVSIPSNIAEGHERRSRAEYRRYVAIACGSLAELETQIELASRLYDPEVNELNRAIGLADEVGRLLRAIERSLRASAVAEDHAVYEAEQPSALSSQP
jgi:four helix bundle protein